MSGLSPARMERLLRLRRAGESAERVRWAQAQLAVAARAGEAEALAAKGNAVAEDLRAWVKGPLDLARLQLGDECRTALRFDTDKAEEVARLAACEAELRRQAFEASHRDVRAIEKLSERLAREAASRASATESRENDDRPRGERP
jgi:hypothetical protein